MIEVRYNLNMVPDKGSPIHINVSQNDDKCRTFIFKLYSSDGSWTAPASATATIEGRKDDGKFFSFACTYSNGEVTVVVQQQMVAVAGKVRCKLKLVSGAETIESAPFYFVVNPKSMPVNADMSKSDVVDAVAKATQKIVDQVAGSIPQDYVKLNEDVSGLKSDIADIYKNTKNVFDPTTVDYKYAINSSMTVVSAFGYRTIIIPQFANKHMAFKLFRCNYFENIDSIKIVGFSNTVSAGSIGISIGTCKKTSEEIHGLYNYNSNASYVAINISFNTSSIPSGSEYEKNIVIDAWMNEIKNNLIIFESKVEYSTVDWNNIIFISHKEIKGENSVIFSNNTDIYLGENIITNGFYSEGWSGNNTDGFVHTAGKAGSLAFSVTTEPGRAYLFEFETTFTTDEFCTVGFGDIPKCLVYNGTSKISVILYSDGGTLRITPYSAFNGIVSNFSLRKIQDFGEKRTLELGNTITRNHTRNNGFWCTLIGEDVAENGYGITRTVAIGNHALSAIKSGNRNIALGTFAMSQMVSGEANVAIGADSMLAVNQSTESVSIGKGTMYSGTHEADVAIGAYSLQGDTTSNTKYNVAIGYQAGFYNQKNYNVFIGRQSGYNNLTGYSNVAVGDKSMINNKTGINNTCLGTNSGVLTDSLSNATALGYNAIATESNQVVIGNSSVKSVVIGGKKINFNNDGTVAWESI